MRTGRRKGGALVLVVIFGAGTLMLVATMLSLSRASVLQEAEEHRTRELYGALRGAIALAAHEVNRSRADGKAYVDRDGNGPGAIGPVDGTGEVLLDPAGRPRCRYRAVVERASTRYGLPAKDLLLVAAAWPDFERPARVVAAEVDLTRIDLPLQESALSVLGRYDEATKLFVVDPKTQLSFTAPDADVAAINVSDAALHADFLEHVVPRAALVEGADPLAPGTLVRGVPTVTNGLPGAISETSLDEIRAGLELFVAQNRGTATRLKQTDVRAGKRLDLPTSRRPCGRRARWDRSSFSSRAASRAAPASSWSTSGARSRPPRASRRSPGRAR